MVLLSDTIKQSKSCWLSLLTRRRTHGRITLTRAYMPMYNTARHESSKFAPFELMFSRKAILPIDIDCDADGMPSQCPEEGKI